MGSEYSSDSIQKKSAKVQLLNKLSKILHKFVNLLFLQNSCLKVTSYSNSILNLKHLRQRSFFGKCLRKYSFWVGTSDIGRNISWKLLIKMYYLYSVKDTLKIHVFLSKYYAESFSLLILAILELFTSKVCEMFTKKDAETIKCVKK